MGAKTKVTKVIYDKLKKELKSPKDDSRVMKKYGLGQTTVRAIRNSISYREFELKTRTHKKAKHSTIYAYYAENASCPKKKDSASTVILCVVALAAIAFIAMLFIWLLNKG